MSELKLISMAFVMALIFIFAGISYAETRKTDSPIVITSDSMSASRKDNTAEFVGSVVAKSDRVVINSERMKVFYDKDGKLRRIEAFGSVKVVKGEQAVTSEEAVYALDSGVIVFTGNPRAVDGNNVLTGSKIRYSMKDEKIMVEGSRVFIDQDSGKGDKGGAQP